MTARDVKDILGARVLVGEDHLEVEVRSACGSDMMSDVLAFPRIILCCLQGSVIRR